MINAIWEARYGSGAGKKKGKKELELALDRLGPTIKGVDDGTGEAWRTKKETRQQKWKRLHPDKVKKAQKELMRKIRAKRRNTDAATSVVNQETA